MNGNKNIKKKLMRKTQAAPRHYLSSLRVFYDFHQAVATERDKQRINAPTLSQIDYHKIIGGLFSIQKQLDSVIR